MFIAAFVAGLAVQVGFRGAGKRSVESIFAHGLSAVPGMDLYARQVEALPPTAPEHATIKAKPTG